MQLIKNEKQKDNFAKYLYDVSKVIAAVVVIGPVAKPEEMSLSQMLSGIAASVLLFIFASYLDVITLKK